MPDSYKHKQCGFFFYILKMYLYVLLEFVLQYLGTDLEEISGRTIMEDNSEMELPLVTLPGTILIPGHIIPLYSHNQHEVAMLKSVVDSTEKTFGVVALRYTSWTFNVIRKNPTWTLLWTPPYFLPWQTSIFLLSINSWIFNVIKQLQVHVNLFLLVYKSLII